MYEFYVDIEKKSVYVTEDMVLERLGDADGDAVFGCVETFAVQDHAQPRGPAGLASGPLLRWANHPVFERTIVCTKRFGKPVDYSGDGIPFYGVNVACDSWHVQAAEARRIALAAKPPALSGFSKEQAKLMKECLRWETEPADVEDAADAYRRHSFEAMLDTVFVPCPDGQNPETFRFYEALEFGCIPLLVRTEKNAAWVDWVCENIQLLPLASWADAAQLVAHLMKEKTMLEAYRNKIMISWMVWKKGLFDEVKSLVI
jgi:hypothetical protein